jgi:hypothetical protein
MRWAVMIKVDGWWVRLAILSDAAEAVKLADTIAAWGKVVRCLPW